MGVLEGGGRQATGRLTLKHPNGFRPGDPGLVAPSETRRSTGEFGALVSRAERSVEPLGLQLEVSDQTPLRDVI